LPNIHRYYVPDAIVFITQVVAHRTPVFGDADHVRLLRDVLRQVKAFHPFAMLAYVFLPDHFHLLLRPTATGNFSAIMHSLKRNFTQLYKECHGIAGPLQFWQKGFWDHVIRDEDDLARHLDYIHYNPARHGLAARPEDWPDSSYPVWQARNVYPPCWGWSLPETLAGHTWEQVE
jgi:putative transposase